MESPPTSSSDLIVRNIWPFDGLYSDLINGKPIGKPDNDVSVKNDYQVDSNTYLGDEKRISCSRTERPVFSCFVVPHDTYVWQEDRGDMKRTDLRCARQGCHPGYTRLCPVTHCWVDNLVYNNGNPYLKHLSMRRTTGSGSMKQIIGFKCEIPDEALEWFERKRKWPSQDIVDKMLDYVCLVSPQPHPKSTQPSIEWKFRFELMEISLTRHAVTESQKKCFGVFKCLISQIFPLGPVQYDHLKQVFFYTCESVDPEWWESCPSSCIQSMIEMLLKNFRQSYLPNYFYAGLNMIDCLTDEEMSVCIDKLEVVIRYPFAMLYLMLDRSGPSFRYWILQLDSIIEDIQRYMVDKNDLKTFNNCIIPCSVRGINVLTFVRDMNAALQKARTTVKHLNQINKSNIPLSLNKLLSQVIETTYPERTKWMFALFLDQKLNASFMVSVLGHEANTDSLFLYFGPGLKTQLNAQPDGDIRIPTAFTDTRDLPQLILDLVELFVDELELDRDVVIESLAYFWNHYSPVLNNYMLSCQDVQKELMSKQIRILTAQIQIHTFKKQIASMHVQPAQDLD